MAAAAQAADLRRLLEQRFPDAVPLTHRTTPQVSTGWAALDAVLPRGGLPRGRLSAWRPGGGATAVLAEACRRVASRGEGAVWIDGAGTLTALGWREGPLLVRPPSSRAALVCAEEVLRSGGWSLLVLAGARVAETEAVRLGRAAREGGGALVLVSPSAGSPGLRVTSRLDPAGFRWSRDAFGEPARLESAAVRVAVSAMGWTKETVLEVGVSDYELRVSLDPGLPDRSGVRR